jgi:hypothetical protein
VSVKPDTNFDKQSHGKRHNSGVLDFSRCVGVVMLYCDFRAKDDDHQEQECIAKQNPAKDEWQPQDCLAGKDLGEGNHPNNEVQDLEEGRALENYSKSEPIVILVEQSVHLPNVSAEICLSDKLVIF